MNIPVSAIEKAYIRSVKEGMARGKRRLDERTAAFNELVIRYKTVKGEVRRRQKGDSVRRSQ